MKTCSLLIACLMLLGSCTKETQGSQSPQTPTIRATIDYAGNPAADGFGWVLRIASSHYEIPINLPPNFQQQDMVVDVAYRKSDRTFSCRCSSPKYMVEIITISKAGS